ncbi:M14 family metallopeptidase [Granulicella sp. dw_53]|uniref:M14 family metallopeptidase n=1 Tax=Granulicella sp. dw_53 TaxID=2719792 RepID=UPI001BD4BE39|nr:M14 family metallopeptidase [Granulicella sp. dw_53]
MKRYTLAATVLLVASFATANVRPQSGGTPPGTTEKESFLENPFHLGTFLQDTNGDNIPDAVCGHIIVPTTPSAAENAAAANLAARVGYESSALTLPIVVQGAVKPIPGCPATAKNIWIGLGSLSLEAVVSVKRISGSLGLGEGAVVAVDGGIALIAPDPVGLLAAADAYAARAPYLWAIPGDKILTLAKNANDAFTKAKQSLSVELTALVFAQGASGPRRAVLRLQGNADAIAVRKLLRPEEGTPVSFSSAREVEIMIGDTPLTLASSNITARPAALPAMPDTSGGETRSLDLARLYTIKGLLTGSAKKPIPSGTAAKLYVPAGIQGVAMANLAARIGLETVGITLPIAFPDAGLAASQIQGASIVVDGSPAADHLKDILSATGNTDLDKLSPGSYKTSTKLTALPSSEGELRVVEHGFGKADAIFVRGDEAGASAALSYASEHLPYLWEANKRFASTEEIRDDLRHLFGLKSDIGQATAALYHLDQWSRQLAKQHPGKLASVHAEIDVDQSDPALQGFAKKLLATNLHADKIDVITGNLHAGIKCCAGEVPQHLQSDIIPFKPAAPTFAEDLTLEWEGKRLLAAATKAMQQLPSGAHLKLEAGVSEGPEQRIKLTAQLRTMLASAGAKDAEVEVFCAYKQGYSWLMDSIAPALTGKSVAKVTIEFAPYMDPNRRSTMRSEERWVQELYPVDAMLATKLKLPLASVTLAKMPSDAGPTYRVHVYGADGTEVLTREFTEHLAPKPYSKEFSNYEQVGIETGWIKISANDKSIANERIATDLEEFWDHYQNQTLPKIYNSVLAQNDGKPKLEYQPLFDTIKIDFHMSEPDYQLGLDQERISALEGLQEDLLFATQNGFYIFGNTFSTGAMDYMGRILPVAHLSDEGQDSRVRIEFYANDAAHPRVQMTWKESPNAVEQERHRDLPAITTGDPRLVAARVKAGSDTVSSLIWQLPVASSDDKFEEWRSLVNEESLEHTVLSAEQAKEQLAWIEKLHTAGLYRARFAYPHLASLGVEFLLPLELHPAEHTKHEIAFAQVAVKQPEHPRPQIADVKPATQKADKTYVQWDQPIGLEENEQLLSRLSTFPGVNVYWMGRSYLGNNIWAADVMLPTPSALRSMAKETTLKAAIVYSGRQHANEVSSTSHIQKLAEELVLNPETRKSLNKVNVVLHPITNPDGAELAMDLAKITPDNMLHAGYHASLTADMVTGQWDQDPVYPESRTRRQLWEAWLPDGFLNPHGYPSHEWVQPFSEYSAWVITRTGAEQGRAWWIPRGWFTSLNYFEDEDHPLSKTVTYTLRDYIVDSMSKAPGVLDMNARMNANYFRYGQQWDQRAFQQPIYKGVRVYMAVTGSTPGPRSPAFSARFPDVTYDDGYTEAPDETARGPWLHLVAGAGLAYDHAHLKYLSDGKFKMKRTQKEFFDGIQWQVNRDRPVLPEEHPTTAPTAPTPPDGSKTAAPTGIAGEPLNTNPTPTPEPTTSTPSQPQH